MSEAIKMGFCANRDTNLQCRYLSLMLWSGR